MSIALKCPLLYSLFSYRKQQSLGNEANYGPECQAISSCFTCKIGYGRRGSFHVVLQDKTFGLKNKKGKRQQQLIKQVTNQVKFGGQSIQKVTVEYIPNYMTFNLSDFLIAVVSV